MIAIADKALFSSTTFTGPFQDPQQATGWPAGVQMVLYPNGQLLSVQPDGSYQTRPAGIVPGLFEVFTVQGSNLVCAYGQDAAGNWHPADDPTCTKHYCFVIPMVTV